jgi:molybdate transport system substrate-binding protein
MATLKVLSAGAVKRGVSLIASDYERITGNRVTVEFSTVPELRKRIAAGEAADVLVATPAAMDEFAQLGKIAADSRGFVGRSRMGIVIHADAPVPAIRDIPTFSAALLEATAVVYNEASSGLYAAQLLEKLGLKAILGRKIVIVKGGAAIMEYVAAHPGAVGLSQISELMVLIDKGCAVKLSAPLPDEIQNLTSYDAAATTTSAAQDAARVLARNLTADAAKKVFAATGID